MPVANRMSAEIQIRVSLMTIQRSVGRLSHESWLKGNLSLHIPQHFGDKLSWQYQSNRVREGFFWVKSLSITWRSNSGNGPAKTATESKLPQHVFIVPHFAVFPVMLEHSVIFRTVSNLTWYFLHWKSCLKRIVACHCEIKPICTFGISAFISCYRTAVKQRSLGFCCHQIVLPLFKVLTVCWNLTLQNMTKWFCTVFQLQVNILGLVGICDFAKSHPLKLTVITYGLRHWWYDHYVGPMSLIWFLWTAWNYCSIGHRMNLVLFMWIISKACLQF